MTWVKLSDDWYEHPKVLMCSDAALTLWLRSVAYSARQLSDGFVGAPMLRRLTQSRTPERLAAELVNCIPPGYSVGLWEPVEGGWMIHDFLDKNPSRESVEAKRKVDADRQSRHRNGKQATQVSQRLSQRDSTMESQRESACPVPIPSRPVSLPTVEEAAATASPPAPKLPQAIGWEVWRSVYETSRRGYGSYVSEPADGKAMQAIVDTAAGYASRREGELTANIRELLDHWFKSYLRDDGTNDFLANQRHCLRFFLRSIPTYGLPDEWRGDAAPESRTAELDRIRATTFRSVSNG